MRLHLKKKKKLHPIQFEGIKNLKFEFNFIEKKLESKILKFD